MSKYQDQAKKKIQRNLQQKIQQKRLQKQSQSQPQQESISSFSNLSSKTKTNIEQWLANLELENEVQSVPSPSNQNANSSKPIQLDILGNQDQKQLQKIRSLIHHHTLQLDSLKIKQLQLVKTLQTVTLQSQQTQQKNHATLNQLNLQHKKQCEELKNSFQAKIDKYLEQIQNLLKQKQEFNQQCKIFIQEDNKMNKIIKDLEQRYRKDIKNAKQAWHVLQKQKREKWQVSKLSQIKQQTTLKLQPQLKQLIDKSNLQIKTSSTEYSQKYQIFTQEYTSSINKKLSQLKSLSFSQGQQEKQQLRLQERNKLKASYEKLQKEFQQDRARMRGMYKDQILELERKRREEVEGFLEGNKISQEEHLQQVKKVREGYEERMRKMKGDVRERVAKEISKIQAVYKGKLEQGEKGILEENQQKFKKAKAKIDQTMALRQKQAKQRIKKQGFNLEKDIEAKYQKKYLKLQKQLQQQKQKLRNRLKQFQSIMIAQQMAQTKTTTDASIFQKQLLKIQQKNHQLASKISLVQSQISATRSSISQQNMAYEVELKQLESKKRSAYSQVDSKIGELRLKKQTLQSQFLQKYAKIDEEMMEKLQIIKKQKNEKIKEQTEVCKSLVADLEGLKEENRALKEILEDGRKRIKMCRAK